MSVRELSRLSIDFTTTYRGEQLRFGRKQPEELTSQHIASVPQYTASNHTRAKPGRTTAAPITQADATQPERIGRKTGNRGQTPEPTPPHRGKYNTRSEERKRDRADAAVAAEAERQFAASAAGRAAAAAGNAEEALFQLTNGNGNPQQVLAALQEAAKNGKRANGHHKTEAKKLGREAEKLLENKRFLDALNNPTRKNAQKAKSALSNLNVSRRKIRGKGK